MQSALIRPFGLGPLCQRSQEEFHQVFNFSKIQVFGLSVVRALALAAGTNGSRPQLFRQIVDHINF